MKIVYLLFLYLLTFILGLSYIFATDLKSIEKFGLFVLTVLSGLISVLESRRIL